MPGGTRVPPPGAPGGGGQGSPGGLQSSRGASLPRFLPGDVEGTVEQVGSDSLVLSQTFFLDKETLVQANGKSIKSNELKINQRVAVTIKDELDSKTHARKATVVRVLQ